MDILFTWTWGNSTACSKQEAREDLATSLRVHAIQYCKPLCVALNARMELESTSLYPARRPALTLAERTGLARRPRRGAHPHHATASCSRSSAVNIMIWVSYFHLRHAHCPVNNTLPGVHTTWRSYPKLPYPGPGDRCYAAYDARLPSTRQDRPREREHPRASLD